MQASSTPELAEFVARLLKRTRQGQINWQERAAERLEADIGQGYSVMLSLVPDFEGRSTEPDQELRLLKDGKELFSVDRRVLSADDLAEPLGHNVDHSFGVFDELWRRALMKGRKVSDHLDTINAILSDDVPF
jgi:hypothetical protein